MIQAPIVNGPYYSYKDTAYFSREGALDAMLLNKDYQATLDFRFADAVFDKVDWTTDINVNVSTLYKMRAKQLREKYDYLIVAFSGGSDSTQIINTFLNNGIFIDEIQTVHHEKLISSFDDVALFNDSETNMLLEYKYSAKPFLEHVRKVSPNTKITSLDASEFSWNQFTSGSMATLLGEKDLPSAANHRVYSLMPMVYQYYMNRHNMMQGIANKTALIRGYEKPILSYIDGMLSFRFNDMAMYSKMDAYTQHFAIEDFFWSPDAPLIPVKQSHMIKKELETDLEFYRRFVYSKKMIREHNNPNTYSPAIMISRDLSRIIYPDFKPEMYAGRKPTRTAGELALIEKINPKTPASKIIYEYGASKIGKYSMFKNLNQIRQLCYTKHYNIGELNFKWK